MGNKLHHYLMSSYLYYICNQSYLIDNEYDQLAKDLLMGWDAFEHPHKYLVTKEDLEAGTLYRLNESDYPNIVKSAAAQFYNLRRN
jgi:hypothetical protein